ncbi:MAG: hypothetical protein RL748_1093 [Pseudomonadota bacterium]|jgi:hypothetical protein
MKLKSPAQTLLAALTLSAALLPGVSQAIDAPIDNLLVLSGVRGNFRIEPTANGFKITDIVGQQGSVDVSSSVRVQFADVNVALDLSGHAGQAYRLYQAALNRTPDAGGLGFWIDALDRHTTLRDIAAGFIRSPEFTVAYGSDTTPEVFVDKIYTNVLQRSPDAGGARFWVDAIKNGFSREEVLALISESGENISRVAPSISNGISFTPMPVASAASGLWEGNSGDGRKLVSVVLENGVFWTLYSPSGQPNSFDGIISGYGKVENNQFNSTRAYDFNLSTLAIQPTVMQSQVQAQQTFNGSFSSLGSKQNISFTSNYNASLTQATPVATVAGTYLGIGLQKDSSTVQTLKIDSNGAISTTVLSSCRITGNISASSKINAYNVSLTFGAAPCKTPNTTVNGIGFYDPNGQAWYSIGINGSRDDGYIFTGVKS